MRRWTLALAMCGALGVLSFGCGPQHPNCERQENCHDDEYCVMQHCQQCRHANDCSAAQRCVQGRCE